MTSTAQQQIAVNRESIAEAIVDQQCNADPEFWGQFGVNGRRQSVIDTRFHLLYLEEAISHNRPEMFSEYINWVAVLLDGYSVPLVEMRKNIQIMKNVLDVRLNKDSSDVARKYLDVALDVLREKPEVPASFINEENPHFEVAGRYLKLLIDGNRRQAVDLIKDAVRKGTPIQDIYEKIGKPPALPGWQ